MSTSLREAGPAQPATESVVLYDVSYKQYAALRDNPAHAHLRMTYYDGTLEIMSPEYLHDKPAGRFRIFVNILCDELDIEYEGATNTTMRLPGEGPKKGKGKEPDQGFYFANARKLLGKTSIRLEQGDPPPDLWIEVDNRGSSRGRLPVYASLGVPEVWQYRARTRRLRFLALGEDGAYHPIERSLSLPMLTPALVLEAMALGDALLESAWTKALRARVREKFTT